jgi:two-component system response regulator PhcR
MHTFARPHPPPALPFKIPSVVLVVDDEPLACKWFARLFADEFTVMAAHSVDEALAVLAERGPQVAVVLTDYSMPVRNGVDLLSALRTAHPHVSRLLISAYADKDVAMAAINQGQVEQILEKPLDEPLTRQALRTGLANSRRRVQERAQLDDRATTLRETLGFLAHEASTPLATVRGYLSAMKDRQGEDPAADPGVAGQISPRKPGELLSMIEAAQRGTDFAQSMLAKFVQTARDGAASDAHISPRASALVAAVRNEYPLDGAEAQWVRCHVADDFDLPDHRDLIYLVLCTLLKNAVLALRSAPPADPQLLIELAHCAPAPGNPSQALIRLRDNGPGISPDILASLTQDPLKPQAHNVGMGLVFCQRVMSTLGGAMQVQSTLGQGAEVTLYFPKSTEETQ